MGSYRGKKRKRRKKAKRASNVNNTNSEKELLEKDNKDNQEEEQSDSDHGDCADGNQLSDPVTHDESGSEEDQFLDDPVDESTRESADGDHADDGHVEIFDEEFDEDAVLLPGEPDPEFGEPTNPEESEEAEQIEEPEEEKAEEPEPADDDHVEIFDDEIEESGEESAEAEQIEESEAADDDHVEIFDDEIEESGEESAEAEQIEESEAADDDHVEIFDDEIEEPGEESTEAEQIEEPEAADDDHVEIFDDGIEESGEKEESDEEIEVPDEEEESDEEIEVPDEEEDSDEEIEDSDGDDEDLDDEDLDDEDFFEEEGSGKKKKKKKRKDRKRKRDKEKKKNKEDEEDEEKKSIWKPMLITLGCILGILILAYGGFAVYFYSHFYFFTEINGVDFSGKSVSDVEEYMSGQVDDYVLTLDENNGTQETIAGSDIALVYKKGTDLEKALHRQNPLLWVEPFWEDQKLSVDVGVTYDNGALKSLINSLKCSDQSTWTESANAVPEYNGSQYTVKEEVYGSKMDMETAYAAIGDAISQFRPELNMEEAGCYSNPKFTKDSPEVQAACDTMNGYIKTSITYDMSPNTEVVNANMITQWLSVNQNDMSVVFNQDAVGEYIANLAGKYDTVGKSRTFTTATGNQASVEGGTYGWQIDQEAEKAALIASIQAGEVATRQPAYAQTAATHGAADWGSTYAEVDLTNQHMWYVQNGSVVFEADIVTGLPTPKKETPAGAWSCLEKLQNKTLRGDRQSDGSYEYETPVAYWMRVTWSGVGFHTATWQPYFGGSRYLTNGSHGCINMSYSDSQTLYGIIQVGDPVIVHY